MVGGEPLPHQIGHHVERHDALPRARAALNDEDRVLAGELCGPDLRRDVVRGNLLLVNPTASVGPGDDCLFLRETADGTRYVLVKRLLKVSAQAWTVRQYNPLKTYALPRKEWQKAHLVIGKYNRTS